MTELVKPPQELKKRTLTPKQLQKHNFTLGQVGEQKASRFLIKKGYSILATNLRVKTHEVDIVALDTNNELVFIEVKTRQTSKYGLPIKAIGKRKLRSLQIVAEVYIKRHQEKRNYRFDCLAITPGKIMHFENITWNV